MIMIGVCMKKGNREARDAEGPWAWLDNTNGREAGCRILG